MEGTLSISKGVVSNSNSNGNRYLSFELIPTVFIVLKTCVLSVGSKRLKLSQHRKHSSLKFSTQCLNECQIMLCKCYWIVLYIVHITAFCLGGPFFSGHGVVVTGIMFLWEKKNVSL